MQVISSRRQEIHARVAANQTTLEKIQERQAQLEEVDTRWRWIKALADTAGGTLAGKEKIMLETYVQMAYFDRIIARANVRFLVMSGGQYELKRRREAENNRSQSGLELDVVDHYNGSQRSVKTLSGGESFKASLSLALGLSDEIQASAGGIRLDTMFVDEGFGSLDEESLAQAMESLAGLADGNRLVGIISHVPELETADRETDPGAQRPQRRQFCGSAGRVRKLLLTGAGILDHWGARRCVHGHLCGRQHVQGHLCGRQHVQGCEEYFSNVQISA